MNKKNPLFSDQTQSLIKEIEEPVTGADLDSYERVQKINDNSFRLRTVLKTWEKQQTEERTMRRSYAKWIFIGLFIEILVANIAFFGMALNLFDIAPSVSNTFFVSVFCEIVAITLIVVRYLFPSRKDSLLEWIHKL